MAQVNNADWQDALRSLLPDGYESTPDDTPAPSQRPKPRLRVELDRKRAGKTATIISGFDPDDPVVPELAAALKRSLATGGSCRGGEILVQGDRVQAVKDYLRKQGYKL